MEMVFFVQFWMDAQYSNLYYKNSDKNQRLT